MTSGTDAGDSPPAGGLSSFPPAGPPGLLVRDRVVVGTAVLLVFSALPILLPVLSDERRVGYGAQIIDFLFLIPLIAALGFRARGGDLPAERRFWRLLAFAFGFWLLSLLLYAVIGDAVSVRRLVVNSPYLLFYGALALALEIHPQVSLDPVTGRFRTLDRVASLVFLFGLFLYFLILPGMTTDEVLLGSSYALFSALDVYIVVRLFGLRQATTDARWRATYAWLLAGAALWGVGDVVLMLMNRGIVSDPGYGTSFDLIWPLAFAAVLVATRAGRYQPETRSRTGPWTEPLSMGPAVVYAVLLPFLHLLLYRFADADPELRQAREVLVLAFVVALGAIGLVYYKLLYAENRRLAEEEERARGKLTHLAFHDELTGLPNREMFQDHLRLAIADAKRYRRKCAVLFCDLDRFKVINDSLGHDAGDQVLNATAERLRSSVRELDTVARFGGDEFTIILHGIGASLDAARLAEKMLTAVSAPLMVQGKKHVLTASLGIAVFPEDGVDQSTLLQHADMAMYQAKLQGRNTYKLFTQAMNEAAEERLAIEQGLQTTPMEDNFVVFYQPIIDIRTGQPLGYEALLRWKHPERGFVRPESFIDVAEQTGLIVPIGKWVLETACRWGMEVGSTVPEPLTIAVNISARQIREHGFVRDVMTIIERTGLAPARLQLEITEPIALDTESTAPVLTELRAEGISIAVDDFGTGFAALSRLKDFPVDVVKIDRSFVKGIEPNSVGETIVRAIVTMSRALDFSVVAEGVETEGEYAAVKELECDAVQGYYLQGPAPPDEIEQIFFRK